MAFWITAALLTLVACLAIMAPIMRGPARSAAGASSHDIEVYRDQLAEVDRDLRQGLIASDDAEQARAEIGRRAIRASAEAAGATSQAGSRAARAIAAAAVLAVPLISWGIYAGIGSPGLPAQPLAARLSADPAKSPIDELVGRAEAHLKANPDDGQGWDVLAPVYVRIGRPADAALAYGRAIQLLGSTATREAGLGEALATASGGLVTPEAREAFSRALVLDPVNEKARFFTALGVAQGGDFETASEAWRALLPELQEDSPWREPTELALAEAAERMNSTPGPTQEQMADAAGMLPEDRAAMIEGMVAQLDERLKENPRDREGWKRLVRSYVVLGRQPQARDALSRAIEAMGPGTPEAAELTAFAAGLGLTATE